MGRNKGSETNQKAHGDEEVRAEAMAVWMGVGRRGEGTVKMELKDRSSRVSNGEGHVLGKREE